MSTIFYTILVWVLNIKTAFAQYDAGVTGGSGYSAGVTGGSGSQSLPNPLGSGTTIFTLLERITYYMYVLGIPLVTILILYGAFQIMTAAGDEKKVTSGKETIKWAVIGFVIVLIAGGIPYIIKEILGVSSS